MLFLRQLHCIIKFFWFIIFSALLCLLSIQQSPVDHARLFITERKIDTVSTSSCWLLRFALARVHFCDCWWHISYKLMSGKCAWKRAVAGTAIWRKVGARDCNIINHVESPVKRNPCEFTTPDMLQHCSFCQWLKVPRASVNSRVIMMSNQ